MASTKIIIIDNIHRSKGNQREVQVKIEPKNAIDITEQYSKLNKQAEKKLDDMQQQMKVNVLAKRELLSNFCKKLKNIKIIDKRRIKFKENEIRLDNMLRGQLRFELKFIENSQYNLAMLIKILNQNSHK